MNQHLPMIDRVAGAPISWGVCEVPGWGLMMEPRRVLTEMREVGITVTELGSVGFFPDDPNDVRSLLDEFGVRLLGGFVPLVLQDPAVAGETLDEARRVAARFEQAGAELFVTAAVVDTRWAPRLEMDGDELDHLCRMLARVDEIVAGHGLRQVLHPHAGTLVEQAADVCRVLENSTVQWCLDTGHLAIGGVDPVDFARDHASRVGLVHLKDVDTSVASRYNAGDLSLMEAVQHGLFRPLGEGDAQIDRVIHHLERAGYDGWYVLEQDAAITDIPALGSGPVRDVRRSVEYLRSLPETF